MKKILLLLLFVLLVSCKAEDDGILSVAVAQEPPTLDVMVNASVSGRNILVGNVYERLFTIYGASIVPCLAEGYELTDDGHTLEIEIRKGVSFHDGSSLDAEDVVSSLNRWLDVYGNAEKLVDGATFEIYDGKVVIHSSSSLALLPYMLASSPQAAVIVPSASLSDLTENGLLKNAPGTGPYVVESWLPGDSIELDVFEGYWGDKPEIEAIKYSFVSDPVTRVLVIESGLYDFIDTVPSDDIPTLRDKGIELNQGGENGSIVLIFNKKEGISCNNDFRKAVSLLIDRDALMKACIVYEDINLAKILDDLLCCCLYLSLICNITDIALSIYSCFLICGKSLIYKFLVDIIECNSSSSRMECCSNRESDPIRCTSYPCNFSLKGEILHLHIITS